VYPSFLGCGKTLYSANRMGGQASSDSTLPCLHARMEARQSVGRMKAGLLLPESHEGRRSITVTGLGVVQGAEGQQ